MTELLILLSLAASGADHNVGLSHLAMCSPSWRCEESLRPFRGHSKITIGWLGGPTFGKQCPCAERVLSSRKPKVVRVHVANGPCLRNRRCGDYEIWHGKSVRHFDRKIRQNHPRVVRPFRRWARRIGAQIARARGPLECYISPVLESDFGRQATRVLQAVLRGSVPSCEIVDNPHRRRCLPGVVCERHGANVSHEVPCIADLDGESGNVGLARRFVSNSRQCAAALLWKPEFNCLSSGRFTDPRDRTC